MTKRQYMRIAKKAGYTQQAAENLAVLVEGANLPYTTYSFVRRGLQADAEAKAAKATASCKAGTAKGGETVTNTAALMAAITDADHTLQSLSVATDIGEKELTEKINGRTAFTESELQVMQDALYLNTAEADAIFFA